MNRLINSKGETILDFDKSFFLKLNAETGKKIQFVNKPDTIAEGIVILKLYDGGFQTINAIGAINNKGQLIIPPGFHTIEGFSNGVSLASRYLSEENYEHKDYPWDFKAKYTFLEVGIIDKTGKWIEPPKKKMEYTSWTYKNVGLTIKSNNEPYRTAAEEKLIEERFQLAQKKQYDKNMKILEDEVKRRVAAAQAQGYLVEKSKG
jgi:hypothetical protein